ncbi:MAG: outer membrane beta-barrel protein [Candidatus Eiseniibacteriota bacterium]|nr:MAG: outer membrane beta-barrel protein [Candidatus Eisenbacteria bacterium]
MNKQTIVLSLCAMVFLGITAPSESVAGPIFEEKGAFTVGFQGQYGLLMGEATETEHFDNGAGYAVRLRYYLGRNRALGVSLERQSFAGGDAISPDERPEEMNVSVVTVDYFWYFDRKSQLTHYITVGAGVHHPGRDYSAYVSADDEWVGYSTVGPDGIALSLGAGLEYFFHRVVAVDLSARGYGLFGQDGTLGSVQAAVGFNFYITN